MAGKEFPLAIVIRTMDKSTAGFDKVTKNLDRVGKKLTSVGKSMSIGVTAPLLGIGVAATKAFGEFEQGMSSVSTLIDTSTESIDAMGKRVLAIGRDVPVAIDDLTSGLYGIRSAGIDAGSAMDVLNGSARLGVAGLGSTAEASDLVTSSLNAFQLKGEDAANVYDNIFKTVKNGKTDIAALAQGFGAVAGTVAATGTPLDEYLASVAALTTTGLPASQAHTQLRAVISGLTRDTTQARKVFKKLGADDFKDLIKKSGGLVPALERVTDSLGGNEAKILKLVGSTEAMGAIVGLTGNQNQAFTDTLYDMREGANAVDEAFDKQNKTAQAQWKRTKNSLTSAAISIGTVLAPAMEKLAAKLQSVVGWFEGLDSGTKETIITIAGVAAAVGPSLMILGKMASAISMVTTATKLLSRAILMNPIGILLAGIEAISLITGDSWATLFDDAIKFWREVFTNFFAWIEAKFDWIANKARQVLDYGGMQGIAADVLKESGNEHLLGTFNERLGRAPASDSAASALGARNPMFDATAPASATSQNHVMVEFVGAPSEMRVKSVKGSDKVDVKTGYQGY